jgi:cysteate synthase
MEMPMEPTEYHLKSLVTGQTYEDRDWILEAPGENEPSLLRSVYSKKELQIRGNGYGLFKYSDWLPVKVVLKGSSAPVTYKSEGLAAALGLSNLYVTFSGYWPERGAMMKTCSFKETEAYAVCSRFQRQDDRVLVVASAGNTARAFARVCSDNRIPLLLCVPEDLCDTLWFGEPLSDTVKLIATCSGGDYLDAIQLSALVCRHPRFINEGGAKNIARRDGMGTTVLSAVEVIGRIPDYYFQAVGSGTGAIAAWEANLRLIEDGRFGNTKMKLMVSQNIPFNPMHDAWKAGSRDILPMDDMLARQCIKEIDAKVLSNRKPPYTVVGGLYDALVDTDGDVIIADNKDARKASRLFRRTEGIDIHPAAAVATASLIKAVKEGFVEKDAVIMLNITGGGEKKFMKNRRLYYLKPSVVFDINPSWEEVEKNIAGLF